MAPERGTLGKYLILTPPLDMGKHWCLELTLVVDLVG